MKKLVVIGLDCADPSLVFDEFLDGLPTLRSLMARSEYGVLRSSTPPITVPAWMCMVTGKDPGQLGVYGFEHRYGPGYTETEIASSAVLRHPTAWDLLGRRGLHSIVLGVPMTYPPRPIRGALITGILTPSEASPYTYPSSLKAQVEAWVGPYRYDIPYFRHQDRAQLIPDVRRMTEQRFRLASQLAANLPWDFLMVIEMGPDRMHHAFWSDHDPTHPSHDPSSPFCSALREYYEFLDAQLGMFLHTVPTDADVVVVSDHGAQAMRGGFCLNEWLMERGDLTLHRHPTERTGIDPLIRHGAVDWSRTRAWGTGGYCGRIFANIRGRQPNGTLSESETERYLGDVSSALKEIPLHGNDRRIETKTFRPSEIYREVNGHPPDLLVHFGDLAWRSIGSVGLGQLQSSENDTGPDHANHRTEGLYIRPPHGRPPGRGPEQQITDVHGWILDHFVVKEVGEFVP